ncbi:MAG TPA: hypothetical protein VGD46_18705 [Rhizobacter sp.]
MASELTRFYYVLHAPEYAHPETYVDASNRTEARREIARAYRADVPRDAARSGYVAFHKCRIVWTHDEPVPLADWLADDFADERAQASDEADDAPAATRPEGAMLDPRVGVLMRAGRPVYYAYRDGDYAHGYVEGPLPTVMQALGAMHAG